MCFKYKKSDVMVILSKIEISLADRFKAIIIVFNFNFDTLEYLSLETLAQAHW